MNNENQNIQESENTTQQQPGQVPISALAISSLIIGCIGLITSFIPIVNNVTPVFSILGIALWIPAFVGIKKGKKRSMPLAIVAIIMCVCSLLLCLACQAACKAAWDNATDTAKSQVSNSTNSSSTQNQAEKTEYKVGETASFKNGLNITVVSVEGGFSNYDGSTVSKVVVKYENTGKDEESFNSYDWKAEDAQGAQTNPTIYTKGDNSLALNNGKLSAGGTKTGEIYFKGNISKMAYSSSMLSNTSIKWVV